MGDKTKIAALRERIGQIMVEKTPRKGFTAKQRREVYEAQDGTCGGCESGLKGSWPIDHTVPLADGGSHSPGNWMGLCLDCHAVKTKREATARAKTERLRKADLEPAEPSRLQSRGFTAWRKMDGTIVRRTA
jgi:5-methylcytosine-specific restriction endonuclease McrA